MSAEMFTYLSSCPPEEINLYNEILQSSSLKMILIDFASLLKTSRNAALSTTRRVFEEVLKYLTPAFYKRIEIITNKTYINNKENENIFSNCELEKINNNQRCKAFLNEISKYKKCWIYVT